MPHLQNKLFNLLPAADRTLVAGYLRPFTAELGAQLHEAGDPIDFVYFPNTGMISLLIVMEDGTGVESATVGNDGAVGTGAILGLGLADNRAIVQLPLTANRMESRDFSLLYNGNAPFRNMIGRANEMLILQFQQTAACNALHHVEARCCRWLLQSHDRAAHGSLHLTQEFLAHMLAVRRTTVNEVAKTLQSEGLIAYHRGVIEVIDRQGLEQRSCECYRVLATHRQRILNF